MGVIVIIGSGIAGNEAAFSARKANSEAEIKICTDERHPLYSACVLADYVADEIPKKRVILKSPRDYERAGIDLVLSSHISGLSPRKRLLHLEDRDVAYDRLILATGSRPIVPPLPGVDKEGVYTLKSLADAEALRLARGTSAVVVGSGPVGIESAIALKRKGFSVVLIELLDRVLPRLFDPEIGKSLQKKLEQEGIRVYMNERVIEISGGKRIRSLETDKRKQPCDLAVLVMGMKPNVELAEEAGLGLGPSGGIKVDDFMHTDSEGIWACGDCVESRDRITGREGLHMLWHNARVQGKSAGAGAAGKPSPFPGSLNVTTVKLFDQTAASVGVLASDLPENEVRILHKKGPFGELCLVFRDHKLVGVQTLGRMDRFGKFFGILLRGGDINRALVKDPVKKSREFWGIGGLQKDLFRMMDASYK